MKSTRNWIIGVGCVVFLAFGGKALATGQDIPDGVKGLLVIVLGAGLGAEPITDLVGKVAGKKESDEK